VKSSPVIAGERLLIGSYDGNLYCLDVKTGKVAWSFHTNGPVHATPSVQEGLAFISGCDGVFRAISIKDGKEMYQITTGSYMGASPAMYGDLFFVGTYANEVLGLDRKAKKIAWSYEHPVRKFPFYSSAAVIDGKVILGGRDKLVHCFEAKTGKPLWEFATRARVESSPAVAGGRVYVGSNDGRLYVLDVAKGTKLFEFDAGGPVSSSPALADGKVLIATQDGKIFCLGG
jgi:outer membrane protein assembly factor BamB